MKRQYASIDIARYVSALLVVCIHTFPFLEISETFNTYFIHTVCRLAVPFFFTTSGFFFFRNYDSENEDLNETRLKKALIRLFRIYLIWTIIYLPYTIFDYTHTGFHIKYLFTYVRDFFLNGSYYHLWFIPMLIGIYILIPVIKPIVKDGRKTIEYFLIIAFIFKVIPDTIKLFEFPYVKYIKAILNRINIEMIGYVAYFVLGHYLNTYVLKKKTRNIIYILGILSVVISIVGTWGYSMYKSKAVETLCREFSITTAIMSIAIFTLFKYLFDTKVFSKSFNSIIIHLSKTSLGIYLVHILFKDIMKNQLGVKFTKTYLTPVYVLIIFIASYLVSFVLSKIPKVNKYIV